MWYGVLRLSDAPPHRRICKDSKGTLSQFIDTEKNGGEQRGASSVHTWQNDLHYNLFSAARQIGIGIVPWFPLGWCERLKSCIF